MAQAVRYVYSCAGCGGPVTKPALVPVREKVTVKQGDDKKPKQRGLHGWSCVKCGKGVKLCRKLAPKEKEHVD